MTSDTARVLALLTPGTCEDFYRRAGEPAASDVEAKRPADFRRLQEAAERSESIELLGPPPFQAARPEASGRTVVDCDRWLPLTGDFRGEAISRRDEERSSRMIFA